MAKCHGHVISLRVTFRSTLISRFHVAFLLIFLNTISAMEGLSRPDYISFFQNQTVFLTGATGGLGGCILYKLASELQARKIFVLCRSESKARATWNKTMPRQIDSILNSDRVKLVVGDILKPNFGIAPDCLVEIAAKTTIVIHSVRIICLFIVKVFGLSKGTL